MSTLQSFGAEYRAKVFSWLPSAVLLPVVTPFLLLYLLLLLIKLCGGTVYAFDLTTVSVALFVEQSLFIFMGTELLASLTEPTFYKIYSSFFRKKAKSEVTSKETAPFARLRGDGAGCAPAIPSLPSFRRRTVPVTVGFTCIYVMSAIFFVGTGALNAFVMQGSFGTLDTLQKIYQETPDLVMLFVHLGLIMVSVLACMVLFYNRMRR